MDNKLIAYYSSAMQRVTKQISEFDLNRDNLIHDSRTMITFLKEELTQLKQFLFTYTFENEMEEIDFFKCKKPAMLSWLIYFNKIYWIETNAPSFNEEIRRDYYLSQLQPLKEAFEKDAIFYQYYRSGATHCDTYYFLRGQSDVNIYTESFFFDYDISFSTFYDYKIACLLANEKLFTFLCNRLKSRITTHNAQEEINRLLGAKYQWTESIAALVQLIYALHVVGCINNGRTEIKELAALFSTVFNVDLGDFYHSFIALKNKKGNPTAFLDSLVRRLKEYMQRDED